MYSLSAAKTETYEKGVDEGRRQILADMARLFKDNEYPEDKEDAFATYLEQEGYL